MKILTYSSNTHRFTFHLAGPLTFLKLLPVRPDSTGKLLGIVMAGCISCHITNSVKALKAYILPYL